MVTPFQQEVYLNLNKIPKGKVTTYKILAEQLNGKAYQAIGQALKRNRDTEKIPCFKVVKSNGEIGGYCGNNPEKIQVKIDKLLQEGIPIEQSKTSKYSRIINFKKYLYQF